MQLAKREKHAVRIGGAYLVDAMSGIQHNGAAGRPVAPVMRWLKRSRPGKPLWMF
jgi:hypothetical protein